MADEVIDLKQRRVERLREDGSEEELFLAVCHHSDIAHAILPLIRAFREMNENFTALVYRQGPDSPDPELAMEFVNSASDLFDDMLYPFRDAIDKMLKV